MGLESTGLVVPVIATSIIAALLSFGAWRRRDQDGALPLGVLMLAVAWWAAASVLEIAGGTFRIAELGTRAEYAGIVVVPTAWLWFTLAYTGQSRWLARRIAWLALLEPSLTLAIAWSSAYHPLIWRQFSFDPVAPIHFTIASYGWWWWLNVGYSYLLFLAGVLVLARHVVQSSGLFRRQSGVILAGALVPWIANVLYVLGVSLVPRMDLTPSAFAVSGIAITWSMFRFRLLDIVPVARAAVVEGMRDGVIVLDRWRRVVDLNPAGQVMLRCSRDDAVGTPIDALLPDVTPAFERLCPTSAAHLEIVATNQDRPAHYDLILSTLGSSDGQPRGYLIVLRDISERKQSERLLAESEQRHRSLFDYNPDAVYSFDLHGRILSANHACERLSGYPIAELLHRSFAPLVVPEDGERVTRHFVATTQGEPQAYETAITHRDGRRIKLSVTNLPIVVDGAVVGVYGVAKDITLQKELEEQLVHQAYHDPLTGIANRALFRDRLTHALMRGGRVEATTAILLLDLDNFKIINDSLGHDLGDRVLITVSGRLRHCLREGDTVARLGGDEFAVLLEDLAGTESVVEVAERVRAAFTEAISPDHDSHQLVVMASIGIAVSQTSRDRPDDLLRNADVALYHAKANGKARYSIFTPSMYTQVRERLQLEQDLRGGLERFELQVFYQPVVDLASGAIREVEALVRWRHPERGLVGPDQFISLAEETGLVVPLGQWVLEEATRQVAHWQRQDAGVNRLVLSVNLSPRQLHHPNIVADIIRALQTSGLDPSMLKLEITETVLMEDAEPTLARLQSLRALGIRLVLDDFGIGYSSLSYLKRLPVDGLKIDRSFAAGLGRRTEDTALVHAMVATADAFGLTVTAEGIETAEQADALCDLGCDLGQGYFFSPPVPAEELESTFAPAAARYHAHDVTCRDSRPGADHA